MDGDEDPFKNIKVRPDTPVYKEITRIKGAENVEAQDKRRRAIILLQRLLRGRAKQNMMFEGKEKRLDLRNIVIPAGPTHLSRIGILLWKMRQI